MSNGIGLIGEDIALKPKQLSAGWELCELLFWILEILANFVW
jgi:hypothetical protein